MVDEELEWFRCEGQALADRWGEPFLLLDGFEGKVGEGDASPSSLIHLVPRREAGPREIKQTIEEFHPRERTGPRQAP